MNRRPACLLPACCAVLAACAVPGTPRFPSGATAEEVTQRMGRPTGEHAGAAGARRLEYGGGAFGRTTWMFDFDPGQRLVQAEQVRDEAHFAGIQPGMSGADVRARIGAPSTTWRIAWQRQTVWSYRYDTPFCRWFMVGLAPDERVIDTAYGPDPLCARENVTPNGR